MAVMPKKAASVTQARPLVYATVVPKSSMSLNVVKSNSLDHIRVRGTEIIAQIPGSTGFTQQYAALINPLTPSMFPKLADIAALFEKWKVGPQGIRFSYVGQCPTTRSGVVAGYVETDASDTSTPSNVVQIINEQISASCPLYDRCSFTLGKSLDSNSWFYTQATPANNQSDRTGFAGKVYWYTNQTASADAASFAGFLTVDYDIEFTVFRPPTSSGFELLIGPAAIQSDLATPVILSDDTNSNLAGWGARAARYLYDTFNDATSTLGVSDRRYIYPPVGKTTNGNTQLIMGPQGGASSEEKFVSKKGKGLDPPPLRRSYADGHHDLVIVDYKQTEEKKETMALKPLTITSFQPYEAVQDDEGQWFYRISPDGELFPYSERKLLPAPSATGDITVQIVSDNGNGTSTVLFEVAANSLSSVLLNLAWSVVPSTVIKLATVCRVIYTGSRIIQQVYTLVGGSQP